MIIYLFVHAFCNYLLSSYCISMSVLLSGVIKEYSWSLSLVQGTEPLKLEFPMQECLLLSKMSSFRSFLSFFRSYLELMLSKWLLASTAATTPWEGGGPEIGFNHVVIGLLNHACLNESLYKNPRMMKFGELWFGEHMDVWEGGPHISWRRRGHGCSATAFPHTLPNLFSFI